MSDKNKNDFKQEILSEPASEQHVQNVLRAAQGELAKRKSVAQVRAWRNWFAIPLAGALAAATGWFVVRNSSQPETYLAEVDLFEELSDSEDNLEILASADVDLDMLEDWEDLEFFDQSEDV